MANLLHSIRFRPKFSIAVSKPNSSAAIYRGTLLGVILITRIIFLGVDIEIPLFRQTDA